MGCCGSSSKSHNEQNILIDKQEKDLGFYKYKAIDIETTFRRFSGALELNSNGVRKVAEELQLPHKDGALYS